MKRIAFEMKLIAFVALGLGLAFFLGACSTAQQATATQDAAKVQNLLKQGCAVVQPTLASVALIEPQLAPFQTANTAFCAAAATIDVTTVNNMINTLIPQAEKIITTSTLLDKNQQTLAIGAFAAFQVFLAQLQMVLPQPTAEAPAPASGVAQ